MLEADAFAQEAPSGSPQALLAVDGLLARRPLNRDLALIRQRAFWGATRWQELSTDPGPRACTSSIRRLRAAPSSRPSTRFVPLVSGAAREVDLPSSPLAGHLPLLALVAMRPPGAPPIVRVRVDGTRFTVPALGPLERVDVPARPGRHRVELASAAGATQVLVKLGRAAAPTAAGAGAAIWR